jgi:hypothetical protein
LVLLYIAKQQKTISNDVAQTLNRSLSNRKLNLAFPNSKILAVCLAGEPSETSNLFSALRNLNPALPSLFSSLFNSMQIHRLKAKNTESEQQVSFHLNQIDSIPSPRVQLTRKGSKAPNLHLFMTERMNSSANTMWSLVFKALLERYFIADIYYGWPHIAKISCDPDNVELSKFRSRLSAWMRTLSQSQQRDFERLNVLFSRSGSQSFAHTVLQTLSRMTTLIVPDISLALVETSFLKVDSNFHLDFQSWLLLKDFQEVASAYKLNETLAPVLSPLQDILLGSVKK